MAFTCPQVSQVFHGVYTPSGMTGLLYLQSCIHRPDKQQFLGFVAPLGGQSVPVTGATVATALPLKMGGQVRATVATSLPLKMGLGQAGSKSNYRLCE